VRSKRSLLTTDLSPGYDSDIDEGIEAFQARAWDSDDEERAKLTLQPLPEEWDAAVEAEESNSRHSFASYLNISNLSGVGDINVKWLKDDGIHVVIPLEGFEFPPDYRPKSAPPFMEHLLQDQEEESPIFSSAYDTRKKSRYKPKPPQPCPFNIRTFPSNSVHDAFRRKGFRVLAASDVISLEPRGTKFCELYPAIVSIPLEQVPTLGDEIYCLYSHDPKLEDEFGNEIDPCLTWSVLHDVKILLEGGRLTFETYEFCSFIIVVREKSIEAQKHIRTRIGGKLISDIPWVEINFPKGKLISYLIN
jgi:hypothetical protein